MQELDTTNPFGKVILEMRYPSDIGEIVIVHYEKKTSVTILSYSNNTFGTNRETLYSGYFNDFAEVHELIAKTRAKKSDQIVFKLQELEEKKIDG